MDANATLHPVTGVPLHRLTNDEVPRAAEMLARTFAQDPLVNWVVRSDARHEHGMRRFFMVSLRLLSMPYDEVWATDDLAGVAMWTPPGTFSLGPREQVRFLWQAVQAWGVGRIPTRILAFNEIERHHPREPHYYLFFIGIDSARAGAGIGTAMMNDMLDRCDEEHMPSYLEATRPELRPFYRRFGYAELPPIPLPYGGPTMYPMWREPRS